MVRKGFAPIFILIILAIIVVGAIFLAKTNFRALSGKPNNSISQANGSTCPSSPIFTKIPVDPDKILFVTPLGNLNPPDHTTPTDHIYLVVKNNNEIHPEFVTKVFAPADITITRITHSTTKKSSKEFSNDYSIDFSPCQDIQAKFGHVTKLSSKLTSLVDHGKSDCQTQYPRPEDEYTYCNLELNEKISSGEELGEVGGGTSTGLDFWAIDLRSKELSYANSKRYNLYQLHTVCPVDLFEQSQKAILSKKFGRSEKKRSIEPLCGAINQDVVGTAQGNWTTAEGYIDRPDAWSKALALVHDNIDPAIGIVSIGGTIGNPAKIQFSPTSSGLVNREFSQVKDNQVYCYEGQSIGFNLSPSGRVLIQLTSDKALKAEYQNSSCQDNFRFVNPKTYYR